MRESVNYVISMTLAMSITMFAVVLNLEISEPSLFPKKIIQKPSAQKFCSLGLLSCKSKKQLLKTLFNKFVNCIMINMKEFRELMQIVNCQKVLTMVK